MASSKGNSRSSEAKQPSDKFMEKLKTFVRTDGAGFLRDPNITSVGIGYKQTGGKSTREISIQFTVGQKFIPEKLDELGMMPIPESFVIDGVEVPTDVLQRSYKPAYKIVAERATNPRKTRIDPIVPGVSVANRQVSAGTIGSIVYDQHSGIPYILSNWHVLHGPNGSIGDDIVQPGPHDDNRVNMNRLGKLVRSHLGAAGDCAIATIEERAFKLNILELNVPIEQIGEAEMDDKVIKSGRTTGVTHGIVTRIK
jgi:endonuclease G